MEGQTAALIGVLVLVGLAWAVSVLTPAPHPTATSSIRRRKVESTELHNWGGCHGPNCRVMSERCNLEYCGVCCAQVHKNLPFHVMAPSLRGVVRSMLPVVAPKRCLCEGLLKPPDDAHVVDHNMYGCFPTLKISAPTSVQTQQYGYPGHYSFTPVNTKPAKAVLTEVTEDEGLWPKWYAHKMKGFQIYGPAQQEVTVVDLSDYNW